MVPCCSIAAGAVLTELAVMERIGLMARHVVADEKHRALSQSLPLLSAAEYLSRPPCVPASALQSALHTLRQAPAQPSALFHASKVATDPAQQSTLMSSLSKELQAQAHVEAVHVAAWTLMDVGLALLGGPLGAGEGLAAGACSRLVSLPP